MLIFLAMIDDEEDKNIFAILHNAYKQDMFKQAYAVLKDHQLAEDAVQDAFFVIVEKFSLIKFKEKCPQTRSFFVNIVKNKSIDIYRKIKKDRERVSSVEYLEKDLIDNFANISEIMEEKQVDDYFEMLPPNYQAVLSLKHRFGYSNKQIAEILGINQENVKKRITRAKNKFEEILIEKGVNV